MKKIKVITVLAAFAFILFSTSNSKASNLQFINSNLLLIFSEENNIITELICNAQYLQFNNIVNSLEANAESESFLEESMEMQDWMMDYNWMDNASTLIENDLKFELWMESPKNWNIYHCN
ncbi:MAG: hypothetical protein ACP5E3_11055 [Bacteroidales bacterium]